MGWHTESQNWARASFTLFYLPASPDCWAGSLGVCFNYPHHCWSRAAPPSWNISILTGPVREVAGPAPSTRLSGGVRTPGQLHQDAAEPGRCSLQVVQGRAILTLVTQSLPRCKQFSSGYETRRKERKLFPSRFEGRGKNKTLLDCRGWGWLPVQSQVISYLKAD